MSKGLESFLKRIRQDPSNETYIERFLVLLEDEEPPKRLPYYRKLFDFLINFRPLIALDVCYQELKVARNIESVRDQIKALGRIERCFLALNRPGKAEVVRNEIDALRSGMIESPIKKPTSRPSQIGSTQQAGPPTKIAKLPPVPEKEPVLPDIPLEPLAWNDVRLEDDDPEVYMSFRINENKIVEPKDIPSPPSPGEFASSNPETIPARQLHRIPQPQSWNLAEEVQPDFSDWQLFFERVWEELNRGGGRRDEKLEKWLRGLGLNLDQGPQRKAVKLLDQALKTKSSRYQLDFVSFLLMHTNLANLESLLERLALNCPTRVFWLAAISTLIEQSRPRKGYTLLIRFCREGIRKIEAKQVAELANLARREMGCLPLRWKMPENWTDLREEIGRRPEPALRHIWLG